MKSKTTKNPHSKMSIKQEREVWVNALNEKGNKRDRTWIVATVFSVLVLFITTLVELSWNPTKTPVKQIYDFVLSLLKAVTTGIVAAAALNLVYTFSDNSDLKKLRSVPYKELVAEIYGILGLYQGKERRNERIDVHMKKYHATTELIEITIEYEFRTNQVHDSVRLLFERCFNGEIDNYLVGINDKLNGLEFYWGNDESASAFQIRDLKNNYFVDSSLYKVSRVAVNNVEIEMNTIKPIIEEAQNGNQVISYIVELSEEAKKTLSEGDKYSTIIMEVSFPMESESYLAITHEYPTYDSKVSVDYSDISSDTDVYIIPATGPIQVEPQKNTRTDYHEYRHLGWMIPKTGYIISWWKNRDAQK